MPEDRIIVTGASRGIGAAIVTELAGRGFDVIGLSRSGEVPAGTGRVCDMTDEAQVRDTLAEVAAEGLVNGLVNCAGIHVGGPSATLETATFEKVMRLNATAVMIACREAYPHLRLSRGAIINIGSFFDKMGVVDNLAYSASKAAVGAITRTLAVEWARDGITVLNVAPGYIETELNRDFLAREKVQGWMKRRIPVGAPGRPEEVARLCAAILCERIAFMTGETIYVDGGQGMHH